MKPTPSEIELIRALQGELPLVKRPFAAIAERAGMAEEQVIETVRKWKDEKIIRRFGALLAHRKAGFAANGMVVWKIEEDAIEPTGAKFATHPSVSHCYARPTFDGWPYRLYTMVHADTREAVEAIARELAETAGGAEFRILFSTREFKKSDTKLFREDESQS